MSKAKIALAKSIGPFCTDFNTRKNYGEIKRKFGKKNVFAQKYDEIRRLDGIAVDVLLKGSPMIPLSCRSNLAGRYL